MKMLVVTPGELKIAGRWDIDFHLPPTGINIFTSELLAPVATAAHTIKTKRDPTKNPQRQFLYVDIASIDVDTGVIVRPQELTGEEAPSRARKVIHAYDIIISTCRPTRGAIAVVPEHLHGQICSTGFSVIRAKPGMNPFYLHFALRLASTLEQFRKWATGSSYPAILDDDVAKTIIPLPSTAQQDTIALTIRSAIADREQTIKTANDNWKVMLESATNCIRTSCAPNTPNIISDIIYSTEQIANKIAALPPVEEEVVAGDDEILEE